MPKKPRIKPPQPKPKPALMVEKLDDGRLSITPLGLPLTEAPTLLRIAAQIVEQQLGIRE